MEEEGLSFCNWRLGSHTKRAKKKKKKGTS